MKTTVRFEWDRHDRDLRVVLETDFVRRFVCSEQQRVWNESLGDTWGWEIPNGYRRSVGRDVGTDAALPYYKQAAIEEVKAALAYLKSKEPEQTAEPVPVPEIDDCVEVEV